ncbi:YbbR-like domain-containing protein [Bacillus gobiensis]|uniref:CdaR family protein n=1 Tax=Bacillus gobiensis TaxID=1441095 RepID=UPI003D1C5BC6
MDKFLNTPWAVRIIALLLAIMLFISVSIEKQPDFKKPGEQLFQEEQPTTEEATLTNIPVNTYFDEENLVVTGVPQTVNVTLKGSTSAVTTARQTKDFEIYADLEGLSTGSHRVVLKARNVNEDLDVSINPSVTTVTIQEKTTENFPVEVDFFNQNKMAGGYTPEQPIVSPKNVKVTGAKEVIDNISVIKAGVDLEGVDKTLEKQTKVTVYDSDGNILPVDVEPAVVDITVPVTSPSKKVPLKINRTGKLPEGTSISSVETNPSEVTIYGPQDVLDSIEFIDGVDLDLSKIKDNTVQEVDIPLPDGVKSASPDKVKLNVKVEKEKEKELNNVSIKPVGLKNDQNLEFLDPDTSQLSLLAKGSTEEIDQLQPSDIELYVDVSNLNEGEHDVNIEVNGPQNITWTMPKERAKVKITSKESENEEENKDENKDETNKNIDDGSNPDSKTNSEPDKKQDTDSEKPDTSNT